MVKQQLIDWIKSQEAQGYTEQQLYNSLIQQGYNPNEVNEAIKITSQSNQQKDQTSKPSKSPNLLLFVIIGVIVIGLIGGGVFLFTSQNDKGNSDRVTNPGSDSPKQEDGLGVSLFMEKEIYEREEPFNLTLNIDYNGEPFKAAIIYDSYRKGFSKHFYNGYIEDVSSKEINRSKFHAGYTAEKAFRIYDGGHTYPQNFFLDEGTYYISVYVYDCEEIAKEGYSCNPSHVFPSTFGISDNTPEDLIKNNVKPLASAEKEIIVKGGNIECSSDSDCSDKECSNCVLGHYRCGDFFSKPKCIECNGEMIINGKRTMCKEGYHCEDYKCVKDECAKNEDCTNDCEGCVDNQMICDKGVCIECDTFEKNCKEGYICEDWGCTNIEVLNEFEECKPMEQCKISDKTKNSEIKCTMSSDPNKNLKCLECWSDFFCKEGYHCYNYECIAD